MALELNRRPTAADRWPRERLLITTEHIVLKHFSMTYTRDQVLALVGAGVPERFRERVRILL